MADTYFVVRKDFNKKKLILQELKKKNDDSAEDEKVISEKVLCDLITIDKIILKIPDNEDAEILFKIERQNCEDSYFRMPVALVQDIKELPKILANHFIIGINYKQNYIHDYLKEEIAYNYSKGNITYEHTCLGLKTFKNKEYFFSEKTQLDDKHYSVCVRDFGKFTAGSEEKYDSMLDRLVFPDIELSTIYVLGFTGVISSRLFECSDVGVPVFGLCSSTSRGKTISCQLAVSIFADPSQHVGSLMLKTDSTQCGTQAQLGDLRGLVLVEDDIDTNPNVDLSTTIYRLANGTPRTVGSASGKSVKREGWKGVILLNCETSIAERMHKSGIFPRYCEFNNLTFTKTAEIAEEIKDTISENFGFKGFKFGEFITNFPLEILKKDFNSHKQKVRDALTKKDGVSNRVSNKYAIISMTMEYLQKCFKLPNLQVDKIMDFIYENEKKNMAYRDKVFASYSYLYDFFTSNRKAFNITKSNGKFEPAKTSTCLGEAKYYDGYMQLCIKGINLDYIMHKGGFSQYKSYKRQWVDRKYVIADKKRTDTTSKALGRHYKFQFDLSDVDM